VRIYNNTIYGYGYDGALENGYDAAINVDSSPGNNGLYYFAGTWEFSNNIVVDTHNLSLYVQTNPIRLAGRQHGHIRRIKPGNPWFSRCAKAAGAGLRHRRF